MKKQTLLLLAGGLLTFAACTNEGATGGYTQEQMDSAVNARVAELQAQMQLSNDSAINALAQIKADEMIANMKGGKVTTKSTTVKSTPTATQTTTSTTTTTPVKPAVADRPGATDNTPKSVSDRPGSNSSNNGKQEPKSSSDRPGAR